MSAPKQDAKADLLPCPFDGGDAKVVDVGGSFTAVRCTSCQATGVEFTRARWRDPEEAGRQAIAAWNRRASPKGCDVELREGIASIIDANKFEAWTVDRAGQMADSILALINQARQPEGSVMATCQDCGGEVAGWLCQKCPREFEENDAGDLVFCTADNADGLSDDRAVAWRYRWESGFADREWRWTFRREESAQASLRGYEVQPLFTRPPAGKDLAGEEGRLRAALEKIAKRRQTCASDEVEAWEPQDIARQALAAIGEGE